MSRPRRWATAALWLAVGAVLAYALFAGAVDLVGAPPREFPTSVYPR